MSRFNACSVLAYLPCALFFGIGTLHADVGIVVYESKGVDARRTSNGHVALIATNLALHATSVGERFGATASWLEPPSLVADGPCSRACGYVRERRGALLFAHFALPAALRLDALCLPSWPWRPRMPVSARIRP